MRRPITVAALACLLLVLIAPAAGGHALLRGSEPAGGASLDTAPERVTLTFTEPPDPALSSVHVLDTAGHAVERGRARAVAGRPLVLEVPVGRRGDEPGTYTVSWRVVSRTDGHLTAGAFAFGVGVQPSAATTGGAGQAAAPTSPPASPLAVAGRWALDWGLILLVGAAASALLVFRGSGRPASLPLPLLAGALALAAAGLVASVAAEHARVGVPLGELLGSSTGGKLLGQAAGLAVTAVVLAAVARWPRGRELLALLGLAAAATMLSTSPVVMRRGRARWGRLTCSPSGSTCSPWASGWAASCGCCSASAAPARKASRRPRRSASPAWPLWRSGWC